MDYLEPEYKDAFEAWKKDETPEGNASMPVSYTHLTLPTSDLV